MTTIDLDPGDWHRAAWRQLPPLPKPPAPPFDREDALRRLKKCRRRLWNLSWVWDWTPARITPALSREEAEFWLRALVAAPGFETAAEIANTIGSGAVTITLAELAELDALRHVQELAMPIAALFGCEGAVEVLFLNNESQQRRGGTYAPLTAYLEGVRRWVRPYLTAEELARLRDKTRQACPPPSHWPGSSFKLPDQMFHLAAILGMDDVVRPIVAGWPDDRYRDGFGEHAHDPQDLIFGLGSADEVETHIRRLKLPLRTPGHIRAWLAHTEATALDYVRDSILGNKLKDALPELIATLGLVRGAEAAPVMLKLTMTPRTAKAAQAWLQANGLQPDDDLPPITRGGAALSREETDALLDALRKSKLGTPQPLVLELRASADRDSLDRFAWRLFELWLRSGAEAKDNWSLTAVGLLGGDASAMKLTPLIRAWPGDNQHARAVLGLECLRAIGSDTALMQIHGIAQKVKFKGIKAKATECMEKIAEDRGLTRAQLEDRIVPDCDLDERGSRVFDFGPRQFTFVLGPDMKPLVRDESGKAKPDLPKPNAKDDAGKAAAAVAEWKLLKKQIAEVAKIQALRLEQAMVTGRRWSGEEFHRLLVKHPLMTHIVRRLVWGVYENGLLATTFRVTEDQTLADRQDRTFALPPEARVGIVHPLQLPDAEKSAWGELLSDYEILPPFPQLARPAHALEAGETSASEITRFAQVEVPAQTLVYGLEKLGWLRGLPHDRGVFFEHVKPFPGAGVTAIVEYEGVPVYVEEGWPDQSIERCFFLPGVYELRMYPGDRTGLPLVDIDPVVLSEVLSDLTQIAAKAR